MRIIVFLLIGFGAAMYFPESRAVLVETARPVLDPVLQWSTRGEMRQLARDLEAESETPRSFPLRQDDFVRWMERNYQGEATRDPWGEPYVLRLGRDSFQIVSPGPDRLLNTEDDVSTEGELRRDVRRRR